RIYQSLFTISESSNQPDGGSVQSRPAVPCRSLGGPPFFHSLSSILHPLSPFPRLFPAPPPSPAPVTATSPRRGNAARRGRQRSGSQSGSPGAQEGPGPSTPAERPRQATTRRVQSPWRHSTGCSTMNFEWPSLSVDGCRRSRKRGKHEQGPEGSGRVDSV